MSRIESAVSVAALGANAAIDVSGYAALKTFTYDGDINDVIVIQGSMGSTGEFPQDTWVNITTLYGPGKAQVACASKRLRAIVLVAATLGKNLIVGSEQATNNQFANLAIGALGPSASIDLNLFGNPKFLALPNPQDGQYNVEMSNDDVNYNTVLAIAGNNRPIPNQPPFVTLYNAYRYLRLNVIQTPTIIVLGQRVGVGAEVLTGGSGGSETLQDAYNAGPAGQQTIQESAGNLGITILDSNPPNAHVPLLAVENSGGSKGYLIVSGDGVPSNTGLQNPSASQLKGGDGAVGTTPNPSGIGGASNVLGGSGGATADAALTAGAGGPVELIGGTGGANTGGAAVASGDGGTTLVKGGSAGPSNGGGFGAAGPVHIVGGNAAADGGDGGKVTIDGGVSFAGNPGDVEIGLGASSNVWVQEELGNPLNISGNAISPAAPVQTCGAGLIKNILGTNLPAGFSGRISILPTAAFTWDATGNIAVAGTAVINRLLDFYFDGTHWFPSYV